jgi:hypothetical protein
MYENFVNLTELLSIPNTKLGPNEVQAQVLHARLRMDSSSLNAHLFLRNLVDNPNCTCGQTETTAHFLLQCKNYSVIRDTTINALNLLVPITAKLLLHGSTALTDEQLEPAYFRCNNKMGVSY